MSCLELLDINKEVDGQLSLPPFNITSQILSWTNEQLTGYFESERLTFPIFPSIFLVFGNLVAHQLILFPFKMIPSKRNRSEIWPYLSVLWKGSLNFSSRPSVLVLKNIDDQIVVLYSRWDEKHDRMPGQLEHISLFLLLASLDYSALYWTDADHFLGHSMFIWTSKIKLRFDVVAREGG